MWHGKKKEERKIIPKIVDTSFRWNAQGQCTHFARTNDMIELFQSYCIKIMKTVLQDYCLVSMLAVLQDYCIVIMITVLQNFYLMSKSMLAVLQDYCIMIIIAVLQDYCLMSLLAGLMGLCMGFSFVSLAEIVYYRVLAVRDAVKREKMGKIGTGGVGDLEDMD